MDTGIIVALITGGLAIFSNLLSAHFTNSHFTTELDKHLAVQDERIKNLTDAVNRHNEFASRVPRLEQRLEDDERRIEKLESRS